MAEAEERTERPTSRKREEARRQGQVAISPEVGAVAGLVGALLIAAPAAGHLLAAGSAMTKGWITALATTELTRASVGPILRRVLIQVVAGTAPVALAAAAFGIAANVAQVGWLFRGEALLPKLDRIGLLSGFKRIFSAAGAANLVRAVIKIAVVGGIAYHVIRRTGTESVGLTGVGVGSVLQFAGRSLHVLWLRMAAALVVVGGLDYLWQRYQHERALRMSRSELKEEMRQSEGDPQIKARFRRAQREMAQRRMLAEVAHADVVLTNPVHVAVALRYAAGEMSAPRVVAKGAGEVAERIKSLARAAGVPIVERRALARALFRTVKLGAEIPPALYRAVAEVLAYVYALRAHADTTGPADETGE